MEYLIKTNSIGGMTEEQFYEFCRENESINFERSSSGDIILMKPTGSDADLFNVNIITNLANWNRETKTGYVFGNNAGFTLPNKAVRSPDALISQHPDTKPCLKATAKNLPTSVRILSLNCFQKVTGKTHYRKMKEWMDNGCRLAWMIDPQNKETTIYRIHGVRETKPFNDTLDGEDVLPGFALNLENIFTGD